MDNNNNRNSYKDLDPNLYAQNETERTGILAEIEALKNGLRGLKVEEKMLMENILPTDLAGTLSVKTYIKERRNELNNQLKRLQTLL